MKKIESWNFVNKFYVNSVYLGTEGEGINIGTPQVFVRFQGCALNCLNCDSKYTWKKDHTKYLSLNELTDEIYNVSLLGKIKRVSITGGDPLDADNFEQVLELVKYLKNDEYFINIEVSGNILDHRIFDLVDFISFDVKTPSTGVNADRDLLVKLLEQYSNKAQIKSVIKDEQDFQYCLKLSKSLSDTLEKNPSNWCLTPSYELSEEFPQTRFQDVIEWNHLAFAPFRVIGQQHKWIYGSSRKDV